MKPITIYYYDGSINKVDDGTKEAVKNSVRDAVKKLDLNIFDGLSIHVASDFSNLDQHNEFSTLLLNNEDDYESTNGITSTDPLNREIYIQETSFWKKKLLNLFSKFSFDAKEDIEQCTMHEIGHQFNLFCGDSNYKAKYTDLCIKSRDGEYNLSDEDREFLNEYFEHNEYSDKEEFKEALFNDLQNIKIEDYNMDFYYYVSEFYDQSENPTKEDVENADCCRSEVFAQLFSYAMGKDDGNKEDFINLFPNTYRVVEGCINRYSR